jgi:hypothetical protein
MRRRRDVPFVPRDGEAVMDEQTLFLCGVLVGVGVIGLMLRLNELLKEPHTDVDRSCSATDEALEREELLRLRAVREQAEADADWSQARDGLVREVEEWLASREWTS